MHLFGVTSITLHHIMSILSIWRPQTLSPYSPKRQHLDQLSQLADTGISFEQPSLPQAVSAKGESLYEVFYMDLA